MYILYLNLQEQVLVCSRGLINIVLSILLPSWVIYNTHYALTLFYCTSPQGEVKKYKTVPSLKF